MSAKTKTLFVIGMALALALVTAAAAGAGDRTDRSFGTDGVSVVEAPVETQGRPVAISDLAAGQDGRMLGAIAGLDGAGYFALARFDRDGAPDLSFSDDGFSARLRVRHRGPVGDGLQTQAEALALQPDGKVLVAGYQFNFDEGTAPLLARFRPDGSLDQSFARGGVIAPKPASEGTDVRHPIEGGGLLHDVAVQPGGRIVVVGGQNEGVGGRPAAMAIAYRRDGSVDRAFGRRGRLVLASSHRFLYSSLTTVEVLRNRKILAAGYLEGRLVVMRLTADGRLDRGFGGGDGKVMPIPKGFDFCCQGPALLAVLPNGRILVGSEPARDAERPLALARLRPDGRLDRSFGKGGLATGRPPAGRSFYMNPTDLSVQGNGRIVVVGYEEKIGPQHKVFNLFTALRYLPSGALDRSFGEGGVQTVSSGGGTLADAALTQPDGQVVVAGGVESEADVPPGLLLTRYLP
jgi:uncharacterized delta-60 repeat protein